VIITPHCVIDISHEFYWNDFAPTSSIKSVNTGKSVKQISDEIKCAKRKKVDETAVEHFMKGKEKRTENCDGFISAAASFSRFLEKMPMKAITKVAAFT